MPSRSDKRAALATLIQATLDAVESGFTVDQRYRAVVVRPTSRRNRLEVMGDPVRYVMVVPAGGDHVTDPERYSVGDVPLEREDAFLVRIWRFYEDARQASASSDAAWEALIYGNTTGLIPVLAATAWLDSPGAALGLPTGILEDLVAVDDEGLELAHYTEFTISVT